MKVLQYDKLTLSKTVHRLNCSCLRRHQPLVTCALQTVPTLEAYHVHVPASMPVCSRHPNPKKHDHHIFSKHPDSFEQTNQHYIMYYIIMEKKHNLSFSS